MLWSPSGFPFGVRRGMIGCGTMPLDTFTYYLLKVGLYRPYGRTGLHKEPGLAAAGTADHQHIFVPGGLGVFGPVVHGEAFRLGQEVLLSNTGSMYGAISLGPPQRALPYSTPRRYFLAFLLLQYTISRSATAPATPTARSNRWKLGAALSKAREKRPQGAIAFPTSPPQPPAGRSVPACRTGKQTAGRAG